MTNATTSLPNPLTVNNGLAPKEGRLTVPFNVDFTAQTAYTVDLTAIQQMQQRISFVQTVYVDNSLNTESISLIMSNTNQRLTVPANSQAYLPMLLTLQNSLIVTTTGAIVIPLQFMNFGVAPAVWSTLNPVSGGSGGTIPVSDAVLESTVANGAIQTQISGNLTLTDSSGSITTGGTQQAIVAANAARRYYRFQNTSSATLWLNDIGNAAAVAANGSIEVAPGQMYEPYPGMASNKAIAVYGATTGQTFTFQQA